MLEQLDQMLGGADPARLRDALLREWGGLDGVAADLKKTYDDPETPVALKARILEFVAKAVYGTWDADARQKSLRNASNDEVKALLERLHAQIPKGKNGRPVA